MNQNLKQRVEKAENATAGADRPLPIILMTVGDFSAEGDGRQLPIKGWRIGIDGDEIRRTDGETEEELQARAVSVAAEHGLPSCEKGLVLYQITDEWE